MDKELFTPQEYSNNALVFASQCMLDDSIWQGFGFGKRPKRGTVFEKFVDKELLKWEKFLSREIFFYVFIANYRFLNKCNHQTMIDSINSGISTLKKKFPNYPEVYNLNWNEFISLLKIRLDSYFSTESYDDYREIFCKLGIEEVEEKYHESLFAGSVNLIDLKTFSSIIENYEILSES